MDDTPCQVKGPIHEDRCTKICQSASKPNILPTRVHGNLPDTLGSREVSVRWIPNQLTEYLQMFRASDSVRINHWSIPEPNSHWQ